MTAPSPHEAAVARANEILAGYALSPEGWRRSPGETVQRVLCDLLHWSADTQRDFAAALDRARGGYARESEGPAPADG
ncbi:hypothetical protein [Streptomyces cacaoi]|uniref:hypothetical protein n=1 Tax=Streptomyces cacaoi TaxID=1898 RepID=UPI0011F39789|nr:hypothetical protein [Streptomyces cacaoi]